MTTTLAAGWGFPTPTARKAHYFRAGEQRSECGKYGRFFLLPVSPDDGTARDVDCVACRRKLEAAS